MEQSSHTKRGAGVMKQLLAGLFQSSDEQAMWRVQMHDDGDAFAQLVDRWKEPIQRLCIRMLGDPHKAQDISQEAFTRIYTRRKDYQHGAKFSTFLWRITVNLCLDELRRIKRRREFSIFANDDGSDGQDGGFDELASGLDAPDAATQAGERAEIVQRALLLLPEHYRTVVILRHYQGLKFREIAEVLGIPEGTVKSRMVEALSQLQRSISHCVLPDGRPALPRGNRVPERFVI